MMDITPSEKNSNSFLMQTAPGCISSCTDYYVTSNGLICTETTMGTKTTKRPVYLRGALVKSKPIKGKKRMSLEVVFECPCCGKGLYLKADKDSDYLEEKK